MPATLVQPVSPSLKTRKNVSIRSMDNGWSVSADKYGPEGSEAVELVFTSKYKLTQFIAEFLFGPRKEEE